MADIRLMQPHEAAQVRDLWLDNCARLGTPLPDRAARQILDNLTRTPAHPDAHCVVAVEDGTIIGFLTCSISGHPVMPGRSGKIEELYVQPSHRRWATQAALVRHTVGVLKQQGAQTIHVLTGLDKDEARGRAFWRQLGWVNDMTVFSIYESVPGDPHLQGVWDDYAAEGG
jgi:GNAT superfamily N-acetyltransferase